MERAEGGESVASKHRGFVRRVWHIRFELGSGRRQGCGANAVKHASGDEVLEQTGVNHLWRRPCGERWKLCHVIYPPQAKDGGDNQGTRAEAGR